MFLSVNPIKRKEDSTSSFIVLESISIELVEEAASI